MSLSINIVIEDDLSSAVARRLIRHTHRDWTVGPQFPQRTLPGGRYNPRNIAERRGLSGFGQIKAQLPIFNRAAAIKPYLVLTDRDIHVQCPGDLWNHWMAGTPRHPNMIFRVAVREVEAWLLADRQSMADFLDVPLAMLPVNPEASNDPKIDIVNLARGSTSVEVIEQMVPLPGSTAEVGRGFERGLAAFVRDHWHIDEAAKNCVSLRRALGALRRFTFTPPPP